MTAKYREEWVALHPPRFNEPAQNMMRRAEGLSRALSAEQVGVDHLLAAAVTFDTNDATALLKRLGVEGPRVYACALGDAQLREVDHDTHVTWSRSGKLALEHAMQLARDHRAAETTTAHVLAGALFMASDDLRLRLGGTGLSYPRVLDAIVVAPAPRATCASCRHWEPLPEREGWGVTGRCRRAPFPSPWHSHMGGEVGTVIRGLFVVTQHDDWCAAIDAGRGR